MWKLLIAGGYSDVDHRACDINMFKKNNIPFECTIIPVRNSSGDLLLVGTWDSHASAESALVLIERRAKNGTSTLALSTAGWPMQQGITSNHIGFAITNLVSVNSQRGMSYIGALPHIANQNNFYNALKALKSLKLCSGRFYSICDGYGRYAGIETDGIHYWTNNELTAHTNNYIFDNAKRVEGRVEYSLLSEKRRLSAIRRLKKLDIINDRTLFELLSYKDGSNDSISLTGTGRENISCAGFILDPTNLKMIVTKGPPNLGRMVQYYLNP
jgi:hypothetical protein